jgi:type I restriction enzyme R subunit
MSKEHHIEESFIEQLKGLKYVYRPDIVDRKTLEQNFKSKFETLNRVHLSIQQPYLPSPSTSNLN